MQKHIKATKGYTTTSNKDQTINNATYRAGSSNLQTATATGSTPLPALSVQALQSTNTTVLKVKRICIWPDSFSTAKEFKRMLGKTPDLKYMVRNIRKITKVEYAGYPIRLDVYVASKDHETMLQLLTDAAVRMNFSMKLHVPYSERHAARRTAFSARMKKPRVLDNNGNSARIPRSRSNSMSMIRRQQEQQQQQRQQRHEQQEERVQTQLEQEQEQAIGDDSPEQEQVIDSSPSLQQDSTDGTLSNNGVAEDNLSDFGESAGNNSNAHNTETAVTAYDDDDDTGNISSHSISSSGSSSTNKSFNNRPLGTEHENKGKAVRFRFCSLNIVGIARKKEILTKWLYESHVSCVLLQETLKRDDGWSTRLSGYMGQELPARPYTHGARGLGCWVSKKVLNSPVSLGVGDTNNSNHVGGNLAFQRIYLPDGKTSIFVGCVYIPCSNLARTSGIPSRRKVVLKYVRKQLRLLRQQYPHDIIIVGGDWNMQPNVLDTMLARWNLGFNRKGVTSGSAVTFHGSRTWSSPDAFIITSQHSSLVSRVAVSRDWTFSDHWPLLLDISLGSNTSTGNRQEGSGDGNDNDNDASNGGDIGGTGGDASGWMTLTSYRKRGVRLRRDCLDKKREAVINSNRFHVLNDLLDELAEAGGRNGTGSSIDNAAAAGQGIETETLVGNEAAADNDDHHNNSQANGQNSAVPVGNASLTGDDATASEATANVPGITGQGAEVMVAEKMVKAFLSVSREVAADNGLISTESIERKAQGSSAKPVLGKRRLFYNLNAETIAACDLHRDLARKFYAAVERNRRHGWSLGLNLEQAKRSLYEARQKAMKLIEECRNDSWLRYVRKGAEYWEHHRSKNAFRWLKQVTSRGILSVDSGPTPVKNASAGGVLEVDPKRIVHTWGEHYSKLCDDVTGNSRTPDEGYWDTVADQANLQQLVRLKHINRQPTWRELNDVLRSISGSKAGGLSGLTPDWFKLAQELNSDAGDTPKSAMGLAILKITRYMFNATEVPQSLRLALVVNLFKSGDRTDPDNYRGISLIEILLKIVSSLVIRRVSTALEKSNRLSPAQAGFRPSEEAQGQIVGLLEICQRRLNAGRKTYLGFIDVRKAFDTVPHGALFVKLRRIGVHGKCYKFLRELYENSMMTIHCGGGCLTPEFELKRGVRQGCPCSPTLFNVFINDILDECQSLGVHVRPKTPYNNYGAGTSENRERIAGLLFADDLVLLCPSRKRLQLAFEALGRWGNRWEMRFGAKKCGVMGIGSGAQELVSAKTWMLQGEEVPVVESYKYLGMHIPKDLNMNTICEAREAQAKKALAAYSSFLCLKNVPIPLRLLALRSIIVPVGTFGGEVLGMSEARANMIQSVVNQGMRWLAGVKGTNRLCSPLVLGLELDLPPVQARWAAARARARAKFLESSTVVASVLKDVRQRRGEGRRGTWMRNTVSWLKRWGPRNDKIYTVQPFPTIELPKALPHVWARETLKTVWDHILEDGRKLQANAAGTNASLGSTVASAAGISQKARVVTLGLYDRAGFIQTRGYIPDSIKYPNSARGINFLFQCRTRCFWTAQKLAIAKVIRHNYRTKCPCCRNNVPETIEHMLTECLRWSEQRKTLYSCAKNLLGEEDWCLLLSLDPVSLAILLLGGRVGDRSIECWLSAAKPGSGGGEDDSPLPPPGNANDGQPPAIAAGSQGGMSLGWESQRQRRRPLYVEVADFLQSIAYLRYRYVYSAATKNQSS